MKILLFAFNTLPFEIYGQKSLLSQRTGGVWVWGKKKEKENVCEVKGESCTQLGSIHCTVWNYSDINAWNRQKKACFRSILGYCQEAFGITVLEESSKS